MCAAVGLAFYSYHSKRNDLLFLGRYFKNYKFQIILNYNLFITPLSIALYSGSPWYVVASLHLILSAIPLFEQRNTRFVLLFIGNKIPSEHFEWIAGLRKQFFVFIGLLILLLVLSPVKFFFFVPLFLLNTFMSDMFTEYEPLVMLNPSNYSAYDFLNRKIQFGVKMFLMLNLPFIIINSFFNPDMITFNLLFLASSALVLTNAICIKYANYIPNEKLNFHADLFLLILAVFVPFLVPISIYLFYANRKKAINHLNFYFHDIG